MVYVSLLVHENLDVILNQIENFNKFYSKCKIIIHISKNSQITVCTLKELVKKQRIDNVFINIKQEDTSWGNVILGHISNIEFIKNLNINNNSIIIFHASNDMIISKKVEQYVLQTKSAFNKRLVLPGSYWWPSNFVYQDKNFINFVNSFGSGAIFASQIEGSFYEAKVLFEIVDIIKNYNLITDSIHYTKEEIFFSTIAHCIGYVPYGLPYVYSEVHNFDRILWNKYKEIDQFFLLPTYLKDKLKNYLNKKIFKKGNYRININTINSIINENYSFFNEKEYLDDGNYIWKVYDQKHLYGVKRVERDMNNPIRISISNMI